MEVLVGSTFSIEVSSPPTQPRVPPPSLLFLEGGAADEEYPSPDEEEFSSESSSSIGSPDDSEEEKEEDGVVSSKPSLGLGWGLGSLDSMEESLPVKRGLSNQYSGKSKSFANLSDVSSTVSTIKEVEKPENPFNKRRRLLLANKLQRKSFYNWRNPKSMPVLNTLIEEVQEEETQDHPQENQEHRQENQEKRGSNSMLPPKGSRVMDVRFKASFKSYSCFSLTDLQEEHDEDDDQ